jgi:hypothetical protein
METSVVSPLNEEEIKPYKIHVCSSIGTSGKFGWCKLTGAKVSTKYLDLTKKKLEITRLPHELLLPPAREWENGTPKSEVEPLIDFWYCTSRSYLLSHASKLTLTST